MGIQMNNVVANTASVKPEITVDAAHYSRLHDLASVALERAPEVATLLLDELARANLWTRGDMPAGVITIGSEIRFRYNDHGHSQTVHLVWPQDANISEGRVSVLTPIGATLLGLSEGDSMEWTTRHGETRSLTVLKVQSAASTERNRAVS